MQLAETPSAAGSERPTPARGRRRVVRRLAVVAALVVSMVVAATVGERDDAGRVEASTALGAGGEYHPITPARVLDTRPPGINDLVKPGAKTLAPGVSGTGNLFDVQLLGQGGLPADSSSVLAVVANVTVVTPTTEGYLRAWGKGATEGTSSIVNFRAGEIVPNLAILVPGADGKVSVRLVSGGVTGTAHVLIDVFGWFSTNVHPESGARLVPAGPGRLYDSRPIGDPLGPRETLRLPIRGADAVNPTVRDIVPDDPNVIGVVVNVTGVNARPASTTTHLSVVPELPAGGGDPRTSNLNLRPGQVKANLVLVPIGADGAIRIVNRAGETDVVVDVVGYLVRGRPVDTRAGRVVPLTAPLRVLDTRRPEWGAAPLGAARAEDWSFAAFAADVKVGGAALGRQSAAIGNLTATGLQRPPGWFGPIATHLTVYPTPADGGAAPPPQASNVNLAEGESVPNLALLRYGGDAADPYQIRVFNRNGLVHYLIDVAAVVLAD